MARRGEPLRAHILWTAKDVFLELGFERTSMDVVAVRAETSKRTLYAHFESKDKLFVEVFALVSELYLGRIRTPEAYSDDPVEAVVLFCGRFLQLRLWEPALRTFRMAIAEADRLPEAGARFCDAVVDATQDRLAVYLGQRYDLGSAAAVAAAAEIVGSAIHPRLLRALLGVEKPFADLPAETTIAADVDLAPIRATVTRLLPP
ncbi:TetR/AcrR family transcriptional regulator [Lentzea sp. NPDC058450]|uniref:TetR/AcrR family transcriptional regulator n=1 Tax=Lentzea sp. NPDC058450 TaxID=3346505 RepID=UPI0036602C47